jgi:cyclopropane-fatty-acyl-phospholipid synthase
LQDWRQFDEPIDRIISISAFEHFGFERYADFFRFAQRALPDEGIMLLHIITALHLREAAGRGLPLTFELSRFITFILTEFFPGGRLPSVDTIESHATTNGFTVDRVQSLQPHYAKTLEVWADRLYRHHGQAVALQSEEVYQRYMKYLNGCAQLFREGHTDVHQFTLRKAVPDCCYADDVITVRDPAL